MINGHCETVAVALGEALIRRLSSTEAPVAADGVATLAAAYTDMSAIATSFWAVSHIFHFPFGSSIMSARAVHSLYSTKRPCWTNLSSLSRPLIGCLFVCLFVCLFDWC